MRRSSTSFTSFALAVVAALTAGLIASTLTAPAASADDVPADGVLFYLDERGRYNPIAADLGI